MCAACHCDRTWRSCSALKLLRCWHTTPHARVKGAHLHALDRACSLARSDASCGRACPPAAVVAPVPARCSCWLAIASTRCMAFARFAENAGTDLAVREHGSENRGADHRASQPRNRAREELGSLGLSGMPMRAAAFRQRDSSTKTARIADSAIRCRASGVLPAREARSCSRASRAQQPPHAARTRAHVRRGLTST